MHRLGENRFLRLLVAAVFSTGLVPIPATPARAEVAPSASATPQVAVATATPESPAPASQLAPRSADINASLDKAKELIKTADFDSAIVLLSASIKAAKNQIEPLREAYLLLIKTWVFLGDKNFGTQGGRQTANLNYDEARKLIKECLHNKQLRHTRLEPVTDYPDRMVTMFNEVRAAELGSFHVSELTPADAVVLLDADTLRVLPGSDILGDTDLLAGSHTVVVQAKGFKSLAENVDVPAGSILERPYHLSKPRGWLWWSTAGVVTAGVVTIAAVLGSNKGSSSSEPPVLGTPPDPPSGH